MPRLRPAPAPAAATAAAADFAAPPTEAVNPRSARLDTLAPEEVVRLMLAEEAKAGKAVQARAAEIGRAAQLVADKLAGGGRLVYVGAGTSGRLGTLDAVECVPTFGVPPSRVVPVIAGGPSALTRSVEGAEDNTRDAEARMRRVAGGPAGAGGALPAAGGAPVPRGGPGAAPLPRAPPPLVPRRRH